MELSLTENRFGAFLVTLNFMAKSLDNLSLVLVKGACEGSVVNSVYLWLLFFKSCQMQYILF